MFDHNFIKDHLPVVWLHNKESHFPMNIETYLSNCTVHTQKNLKNDFKNKGYKVNENTLVVDDKTILSSTFFDTFVQNPDDGLLTLQLRPERTYWNRGETDLNSVPVYVYEPPGIASNGKKYIHYIFFYSYNAPFLILGLFNIGAHDADIERVTLEVDPDTLKVERIFFGAHGQGNGRWIDWDKAEKYENTNRPIVYVARGSHACYPEEGYYIRFAGAANDRCNKGYSWNIQNYQLLVNKLDESGNINPLYDPSTMGFLNYAGDWGFGHVSSLMWKSWWTVEGASKEKYDKSPLKSIFNFRIDFFVIFLLILIFIVIAIIGWSKWYYYRKNK